MFTFHPHRYSLSIIPHAHLFVSIYIPHIGIRYLTHLFRTYHSLFRGGQGGPGGGEMVSAQYLRGARRGGGESFGR